MEVMLANGVKVRLQLLPESGWVIVDYTNFNGAIDVLNLPSSPNIRMDASGLKMVTERPTHLRDLRFATSEEAIEYVCKEMHTTVSPTQS